MGIRFAVVLAVFVLTYGGLVFHMYNIQLNKGEQYSLKAIAQNSFFERFLPKRGIVYFTDRNANEIPVALNREYPVIYAVPKEVEEIGQVSEISEMLAPIVEWKPEELAKALSKPGDLYELLVQKATPEQIKDVDTLSLKGIYKNEKELRYYPFKKLASQTLGFVGENESSSEPIGLYGVEKYYGTQLERGKDLHLTIDRNLQAQAEEVLTELLERTKAVRGTAIIQEPSTGKILALANKPDFDPNDYGEFELGFFLNPSIQNLYEPGSVFKVITMAAGIDSGKITPETVYTDYGSVTFNGKKIENWDKQVHGRINMTQVLEKSVNTGSVFAQRAMGADVFYNYLVKFGFGEITGIDLPGEVKGSLGDLSSPQAGDIDFATASFGQGVAVTPLALINSFSAVANGGVLMRPYVNAEWNPQVVKRVLSEETSRKVAEMMVSAVEKAGVASISNYRIAGKTGTAQIPDFKRGGYTDEVINTYAGFAPVSSPKFTILIKIEKPNGAPLAGTTVVPAFRDLAQFVLNYYNIPPDKTE